MKSEFTIGKVLRARGLKGEFKVELYTSNPSRFSRLKSLKINDMPFDVEWFKAEGDFAYVKLKGVESMDDAEKLRGKSVVVERINLPKLPDGQNYIADLIGMSVVVNGDIIGELVDILQYGSADVYVVVPKDKKGTISFPALKELIKSTDLEKGEITLDGYVFQRVAVTND
ncbi:MAG: ribosome maturation factor RimM [Clostridia bacterium]|nr:ribosome maturation factor RimM [Clostridia bacterium]